jgi:large subunit ribosomal protein L31e
MAEQKNEIIEREYVISLRKKCNIVPRYKKTNKAVKTIKEFIARHMKIRDRDLKKIKIDKYLNEFLWDRGIKNPPLKIKVRAKKENEVVRVELAELPDKLKYKKIRETKIIEEGKEKSKKKKEEKMQESNSEVKEEQTKENLNEETKEKIISSQENQEKIEKEGSKKIKHETKIENPKEKKNTKKGYNKSSQGH